MSKELLKNAVRFFYDIQNLRMQSGARSTKKYLGKKHAA